MAKKDVVKNLFVVGGSREGDGFVDHSCCAFQNCKNKIEEEEF